MILLLAYLLIFMNLVLHFDPFGSFDTLPDFYVDAAKGLFKHTSADMDSMNVLFVELTLGNIFL